MKQLLTICIVLGGLSIVLAQGLQGNVTLAGSVSVKVTGHAVALSWGESPNATSYNVYRSRTHGGPYTKISSGLISVNYSDTQVIHGQTLYYVTTAVSGSNESAYSNETTAVIP